MLSTKLIASQRNIVPALSEEVTSLIRAGTTVVYTLQFLFYHIHILKNKQKKVAQKREPEQRPHNEGNRWQPPRHSNVWLYYRDIMLLQYTLHVKIQNFRNFLLGVRVFRGAMRILVTARYPFFSCGTQNHGHDGHFTL